ADDYLPKPFSPQELVLRVAAVLRRLAAPAVAAGGLVTAGPIAVDRHAHRVTVNGSEVELTATEFKLLTTLLEREGRVQSRAQLPADSLRWPDFARQLGATVAHRITLIDPTGRVRGDTEFDRASLGGLENHLMRPEVQQALASGEGRGTRLSASTNERRMYVAL